MTTDLVYSIDSGEEIQHAARELRETAHRVVADPQQTIEILDRWGTSLDSSQIPEVPGMPFLRLWLRRSTLETLFTRELGEEALHSKWRQEGRSRLRPFPLGVIGHWPAGNIEIQPILSMTCSLLGGNSCLVRVPAALVGITRIAVEKLAEADGNQILMPRIFMASFHHSRRDIHEAMARAVDGAMIWGDADSVSQVRALPFPHWARVLVFGPRYSVAAMDAQTWGAHEVRSLWCQRIARDVWQFDQKACSSPQVLFLERGEGELADFMKELKQAFEAENRAHPRQQVEPALASAICQARASWLLSNCGNTAYFPASPDWTILQGTGIDIPKATQGRTLTVLVVDDLFDLIAGFDGTIQTIGVAICDQRKEDALAQAAGHRGVDRIVKIGQMHVFGSPWDGTDLVRPLVRLVRQVRSSEENREHQNGRCATLSRSIGS